MMQQRNLCDAITLKRCTV